MTAGRTWSGPAGTMWTGVDTAVAAAQAGDAAAFAAAGNALDRLDREQLRVLLGTMTRDLLERAHPDGLDSDDAREVLTRCTRWAVGWYEPFDATTLLAVLAGALGVHDPDDAAPPAGPAAIAHGLLLIAHQLMTGTVARGQVLDAAMGELLRAQTVEMP